MNPAPIRFLHEPRTEQEVVCVFIALLEDIDELAKPIIIERIHEAFPDCTLQSAGTCIPIEFKLYAESYNHAFDGSVVVCWKKGRDRDWPNDFRIIELEPVATKKRPDLFISIDDTYWSGRPWSEETFFTIAKREDTCPAALDTMREIIQWAKSTGFGPIWKRDPKPQFDVGPGEPYFTVWSDGKFRLVVKRFANTGVLTQLIGELKRAVPGLNSSLASVTAKKRVSIAEHLSDPDMLKGFLGVWERFEAV